jgi:hypothetical protein
MMGLVSKEQQIQGNRIVESHKVAEGLEDARTSNKDGSTNKNTNKHCCYHFTKYNHVECNATGTRSFCGCSAVVCMYANVVGMVQINEGLEIGVQGKLCGW